MDLKEGDIIYILFMVLNKVEYLDDILNKLTELGITGGTIIDSTGMAESILCDEKIPTVGGLRALFEYCREGNKTIFTVIENKEKLEQAQEVIKGEICDFRDPGVGVSFAIPIQNTVGIPPKTKEVTDK